MSRSTFPLFLYLESVFDGAGGLVFTVQNGSQRNFCGEGGKIKTLIIVPATYLKGFINWVAKLICNDKLFLNNRESVGHL